MDSWLVPLLLAVARLPVPAHDRAVLLLDALDRLRATALVADRPVLLDEVYPQGSALARRDRQVLGGYRSRGLRLQGARLVVDDVDVVTSSARRIVVDVVDRLGPTAVVDDAGRTRWLPRDERTRHHVTLTLTSSGWRISAVT